MNRLITLPILVVSSLFAPVACFSQDPGAEDECPMFVRPVIPAYTNVAFNHFDEERAEEITVLTSGDLIIVRFNADCDLGFDAALFHQEPFQSAAKRRQAASNLVRLFRDYDEHNQFVEKTLAAAPEFEQAEFRLAVQGPRLDEEYLFRLVNIETSPDIDSAMFRYVLSFSWMPPSGE